MNDDCQLSAHRFGGRPGGHLVFGLASITSLMSRYSALLTCSFNAFLLLLTNFTTSSKSHRSRMSTFFILPNLVFPRMALKVFISVVLKSCFVLVVAAVVSAPQVIIGPTTALYIFILLSTVTYLFLQVTSRRSPDIFAPLLVSCRTSKASKMSVWPWSKRSLVDNKIVWIGSHSISYGKLGMYVC